MAAPTNRVELSTYCLRKLGEPVIQVNVAAEQIEDRIDEALHKFYERSFIASEEVFIMHDITAPVRIVLEDSNGDAILDSDGAEQPILDSAGDETFTTDTDTDQGYIQLASDIIGVSNVFRPQMASGINAGAHNSEFYADAIYRNVLPGAGHGGMSYFYMIQSQLSLINRFFNPDKQYDFNPITGKLVIAGGLKDSDKGYGGLIIRAMRRVHGEEDSNTPAGTIIHNIWKHKWLQDYTTALIKQQWAQNLSKYQSVQLLGGVQMNGVEMMSQANADIERLEQQLQDEYEEPVSFFMA